jgi:RNA polymerase sigma-70 factor, ECF subfamily
LSEQRSRPQLGRPQVVRAPPAPDPAGPADDSELVLACGRGDSGALGELFDRHSGAVYRFFSRLVGVNAADLDELVSETFLNVHRSAARFRGHAAVRTWITAIAANVGRHHVRSESRRRAFLTTLKGYLHGVVVDADRAAERRDLLRKLGASVSLLPYDLRVAYVMCDLEEISGVEAARVLGVPEGTLWRRLHDARRALREALEGQGR